MAAAETPCSTAVAKNACRSVASGVVSWLVMAASPILVCTPPTSPVAWPAARRPASSR